MRDKGGKECDILAFLNFAQEIMIVCLLFFKVVFIKI
jgi:hypothetical protein